LSIKNDRDVPDRFIEGAPQVGNKSSYSPISDSTKSNRKVRLDAIQKDQAFQKELAQLEDEWHLRVITNQMVEKTLENYRSTIQSRLVAGEKLFRLRDIPDTVNFAESAEYTAIVSTCPLPAIDAPVMGIHVNYFSSKAILVDDYDRLAAFCDRHADQTLWFGPQQARDAQGALLPLDKACENLCLKHGSSKKLDLKSLDKHAKEAQAWRWLIISHNHLNRLDRVKLHPKLSVSYERKIGKASPPVKEVSDFASLTSSLKEILASKLTQQPSGPVVSQDSLLTFLGTLWNAAKVFTNTYADADDSEYTLTVKKDKVQFSPSVQRWNLIFRDADRVINGEAVEVQQFGVSDIEEAEGKLLSAPRPDTPLDDHWEEFREEHPESFDQDGHTFFRFDIDFIDIKEGQYYLTTTHNDVEYHAVAGVEVGPSKTAKAKGKTAVKPLPDTPKTAPSSPKNSSGKAKGAKQPNGKDVPPLAQENPLKVKGEPKSNSLAEVQRLSLRKFFKLEEGLVPSEVWQSLSSKGKAEALSKRSIPKWATEAVLRDSRNLQGILEGKITKESMATLPRGPKVAVTKNSSAALEAWLQLKQDFSGTPLLTKPVTSREKAFRKRFDTLLSEYGEQACFPRLRSAPSEQGRNRRQGSGGQQSASDLIDMAKAFGEIARAFRAG